MVSKKERFFKLLGSRQCLLSLADEVYRGEYCKFSKKNPHVKEVANTRVDSRQSEC